MAHEIEELPSRHDMERFQTTWPFTHFHLRVVLVAFAPSFVLSIGVWMQCPYKKWKTQMTGLRNPLESIET